MHSRAQAPLRTCGSQGAQALLRGQGTIEYLVILVVVIVIGLAIVALSADIMSVNSAKVGPSEGKLSNKIGVGGISITDSVVDSGGDGIISLANNSGGNFTLTKITPLDSKGNEGTANKFNSTMVQGSSRTFSLSDLNTYCTCYPGDKTKTCSFELTIIADTGLEKTVVTTITIECMSNITSTDLNRANQPVDCLLDENTCLGTNYLTCGSNNVWVNHGDTNGYCNYYPSCYFGQTSCSGLNYLTCDNNYDWTNNGLVHGRCGYTAPLGSLANPWVINSCQGLQDMNLHLDGNYLLGQDVNCYTETHSGGALWNSGAGFNPIGNSTTNFSGDFNGGQHVISNIYINRTSQSGLGLFGYSNGNIHDVGLVNVSITGPSAWQSGNVGGLVGVQLGGSISRSYSTGSVTGNTSIGGLVGYLTGSISRSYSAVNVTGTGLLPTGIGGLAGSSDSGGIISNSYANGNVSGSYALGGFVGSLSSSSISNSYSTGATSVSSSSTGGFVGYQLSSSISNSYSTGRVNGGGSVGGLVGSRSNLPNPQNSYWYDVLGDSASNCYNGGNDGCTKINDTNGGVSWFYTDTNAPLNSWDFVNIWTARDNNYPILK